MILTIFLSGMVVSILLDWYYLTCVKNGVEIESYPRQYLKYNKYQLFRSWVLWATLWPLVLSMVIFSNVIMVIVTNVAKWVKS